MHNSNPQKYRLYAVITGSLIAVAALVSIVLIIHGLDSPVRQAPVADIYQNGRLIMSLDLGSCGDRIFTVSGDNGCYNTVEVHDGEIGITSASCPDNICVHQGFTDSPLLPITCLPNNVVITVHESENSAGSEDIDITTY